MMVDYKGFEEDLKIIGLPVGIRRDVLEALVDLNKRIGNIEKKLSRIINLEEG